MHYIEEGKGDPIIFLHGMPTSSYVWRNIIPYLSTLGRCIAIDLIGMGKSDKPNIEYTIEDHIRYIEKFIETLKLKNITFVLHEWGSIIGFDYAMRHEKNCKGLVFYEAYLRPFNNEDISLPFEEHIHSFEESESVYDITQDGTQFVDKALLQGMIRPLNKEEKSRYFEPFLEEGSGKPLSQYIKEIPYGKNKEKTIKLIENYSKKLQASRLPKLMLYSIPGFITTMATIMWAKDHLPNLEITEIGEALHYAQETDPSLMGEAISIWLQGVEQNLPV